MIEVRGAIEHVEVIAQGPSIRENSRLLKIDGGRRWKKLKGVAEVELPSGELRRAEVHWYEAHGIGRRELKIKRFV